MPQSEIDYLMQMSQAPAETSQPVIPKQKPMEIPPYPENGASVQYQAVSEQ